MRIFKSLAEDCEQTSKNQTHLKPKVYQSLSHSAEIILSFFSSAHGFLKNSSLLQNSSFILESIWIEAFQNQTLRSGLVEFRSNLSARRPYSTPCWEWKRFPIGRTPKKLESCPQILKKENKCACLSLPGSHEGEALTKIFFNIFKTPFEILI